MMDFRELAKGLGSAAEATDVEAFWADSMTNDWPGDYKLELLITDKNKRSVAATREFKITEK